MIYSYWTDRIFWTGKLRDNLYKVCKIFANILVFNRPKKMGGFKCHCNHLHGKCDYLFNLLPKKSAFEQKIRVILFSLCIESK